MADFRKNNKEEGDGYIEKLVNIRRVVKVGRRCLRRVPHEIKFVLRIFF